MERSLRQKNACRGDTFDAGLFYCLLAAAVAPLLWFVLGERLERKREVYRSEPYYDGQYRTELVIWRLGGEPND